MNEMLLKHGLRFTPLEIGFAVELNGVSHGCSDWYVTRSDPTQW